MTGGRVAYVCSDRGIPVDGVKGASVHLREMASALARAGLAPHVFARRGDDPRAEGVRVSIAPASRRLQQNPAKEIAQLVEQTPMLDLLLEHGPFDVILERYSLFGMAGLTCARERGAKFVLEVNAPLWEEAAVYRDLESVELARGVARTLFRGADAILAVSPRLAERVVAEGAQPDRVHVFPNGVAPEFVGSGPVASRPAEFGTRPVLVFVGSLKPWHGIEFLLRAHAEGALGDVALWVVGDGPMREHVEAAVAADPARIRFEGPVRHEAVAAILRASDAALAPYLDSAPDYFCPLKALEAMCVGVPLLAAAVPAITHLEHYGSRIHLFEPGSARSLGESWERCRQSPDSRRIDAQAHTWDARVRELSSLVGSGLDPVGASA